MAAAAIHASPRQEGYTLGYQGLDVQDFLDRLTSVGVEQVVDIRERAQSRKRGFSGRPLEAELRDIGISYRHIPELGSPSAIRTEYRRTGDFLRFKKEYERYLRSREAFLLLLATLIAAHRTALLCFEHDSATCHRSVVCRRLERRGFSFNHL